MLVECAIPQLPTIDGRPTDIGWVVFEPSSLEHIPQFTQVEQMFWTTTVLSIDNSLSRGRDNSPTGDLRPLITWPQPASVHRERRDEINNTVTRMLNWDQSMLNISLAQGSLADMTQVWNDPRAEFIRDRMYAAITAGTHGIKSETTRVHSTMPQKKIEGSNPVLIRDDVIDRAASFAVAVEEVVAIRLGRPVSHKISDALATSKYQEFKNHAIEYRTLIRNMRESNILLAATVYKNQVMYHELFSVVKETLTKDPHDPWATRQNELLHLAIRMKPQKWLMGLGMDTNIEGTEILKRIDPDLLANPVIAPYIEHLAQAKLRIGSTIEGLIALRNSGTGRDYEAFVNWVCKEINRKLHTIVDIKQAQVI